jgi:excisionase family DNA binding protein
LKNYAIALSIFCLAISIVIGSLFISKGLSSQHKSSNVTISTSHKLLTLQQVSSYLGISQNEVLKFITTKDHEIDNEIPHIKIGNKYYFNKQAVNNWFQKANIEIP